MQSPDVYRDTFNHFLEHRMHLKEPRNLYEPMRYLLDLGGKRLRPVMTLMAADLFGQGYEKALEAALAIELFHNFSLVHDDIMDGAPLRRGMTSVHMKWNINTAILSGDAMLIRAYQLFETYPPPLFQNLLVCFSATALKVCEGQQRDMDFETSAEVTLDDYLDMISGKTAVLLGTAMQMGAMIVSAPEEDQRILYEFGRQLGIAFQLQDDYLDTFGDPLTFGKQPGGDILAKKKTFLYLKALELASETEANELSRLYCTQTEDATFKIQKVSEIYTETNAAAVTLDEIRKNTSAALHLLDALSITEDRKNALREFGTGLMKRIV